MRLRRSHSPGQGIPEGTIGRVFDPFFTTKPQGKGTGLGLSQVYGFAKQARGAVSIKSQVGIGTEVTITFPRCVKPPSIEAPRPLDPPHSPKLNILLVEDNAAIAEVTKASLEADGHYVVHAEHGEAALKLVDKERFDVVFSDIVMPGAINGIELARQIKILPTQPPVLLTTGYSDQAEKAVDEGFKIIAKPYALESLRESLTAMVTDCTLPS